MPQLRLVPLAVLSATAAAAVVAGPATLAFAAQAPAPSVTVVPSWSDETVGSVPLSRVPRPRAPKPANSWSVPGAANSWSVPGAANSWSVSGAANSWSAPGA